MLNELKRKLHKKYMNIYIGYGIKRIYFVRMSNLFTWQLCGVCVAEWVCVN